MLRRSVLTRLAPLSPFILALACGGTSSTTPPPAAQNANLANGLGYVDANGDHVADTIDINHDGVVDGLAISANGTVGLGLDTDCDGIIDAVDTDGDGAPNLATAQPKNVPGCKTSPVVSGHVNPSAGGAGGAGPTGGGGAPPAGGAPTTGGKGGAGAPGTAGGSTTGSQLGKGVYQGSGMSTDRYEEVDVYRNGVGYKFIGNGWNTGWQNHNVSWNGTSFKVLSMNGTPGDGSSPAGYPDVFCGFYTMKQSDKCGLPAAVTSLTSVKTGWRWAANGNNGQYNAAWDIWIGNGNTLSSYLMVWLRDPPGQQPAGNGTTTNATVTGLPGLWKIWTGSVNGHPIVNYIQPEGRDLGELEFDVLDVYRDAIQRKFSLPGTTIMAVAAGFEVWNGPVTNLVTDDFYVDVK